MKKVLWKHLIMNGFFPKGIEIYISFSMVLLFEVFRIKQCSDRSSSPATLGVNNMLGKKEKTESDFD